MSLRLTSYIILSCLLFPVFSLDVQASQPPLPKDKQEALNAIQERMAREKSAITKLTQESDSARKEMENLQDELVTVSRSIQTEEQALSNLQTDLEVQETRLAELNIELAHNRKTLSHGLSAALRLRQMPAETLFIRTDAPVRTARTAMLLKHNLPPLKERLNKIAVAMTEAETVKNNIARNKQDQEHILAKLKEEEIRLAGLIERRQDAYKKKQSDLSVRQKRLSRLAEESESLGDLVIRVQRENRALTLAAISRQEKPPRRASRAAQMLPGLPSAGQIEISFGQPDRFGAAAQGLSIRTPSGALVSTPLAGVIKYAGPFKHYGQLIIIEHEGRQHSLLAGFEELKAGVGQYVAAGEPVAVMPDSKNRAQAPSLYFELRYDGQPTDPLPRIAQKG